MIFPIGPPIMATLGCHQLWAPWRGAPPAVAKKRRLNGLPASPASWEEPDPAKPASPSKDDGKAAQDDSNGPSLRMLADTPSRAAAEEHLGDGFGSAVGNDAHPEEDTAQQERDQQRIVERIVVGTVLKTY